MKYTEHIKEKPLLIHRNFKIEHYNNLRILSVLGTSLNLMSSPKNHVKRHENSS